MDSYRNANKLPVSWVIKEVIKFVMLIALTVAAGFIAVGFGA